MPSLTLHSITGSSAPLLTGRGQGLCFLPAAPRGHHGSRRALSHPGPEPQVGLKLPS